MPKACFLTLDALSFLVVTTYFWVFSTFISSAFLWWSRSLRFASFFSYSISLSFLALSFCIFINWSALSFLSWLYLSFCSLNLRWAWIFCSLNLLISVSKLLILLFWLSSYFLTAYCYLFESLASFSCFSNSFCFCMNWSSIFFLWACVIFYP